MKSNETIDAVADVAAAAAAGASEDLGRVRARVGTTLDSVRKSADRQVRQALDASSRTARAANEYAQANPWKAIGIAAIAGLALGSLLMSRRERRT
jgi:ElaB/YqjD/DUF883 family membrane-anchored ribosome-binding protein